MRTGGDWIEADDVILACPAWSAAQLLGNIDANLTQRLNEIPYSSSLTLSLIYDAAKFDGRRAGFGFLVPKRERKRIAAATFVATKFPFRAPDNRIILRVFMGGATDEVILSESDETILAIAREELRSILNLTAAPLGALHFALAALDGPVHRRAQQAHHRNQVARGCDPGAASCGQRLRRHRNTRLRPHRPRGGEEDHRRTGGHTLHLTV